MPWAKSSDDLPDKVFLLRLGLGVGGGDLGHAGSNGVHVASLAKLRRFCPGMRQGVQGFYFCLCGILGVNGVLCLVSG